MAHLGNVLAAGGVAPGLSSWSAPFTADVAPGSLVVATFGVAKENADSTPSASAQDTAGNTWELAGSCQSGGSSNIWCHVFYTVATNGLTAGKDALEFSKNDYAPGSGTCAATAEAFGDWYGSSPIDEVVVTTVQDPGAAVSLGPTATTSSANQLVWMSGVWAYQDTPIWTAGSGYTAGTVAQRVNETFGAIAASEWKYVSATGTQTATATINSFVPFAGVLATFAFTPATSPQHQIHIDWDADGSFTEDGDDVTDRILARESITVQRGRDQARALSPMAVGSASFLLDNESGDYSPENSSSPLNGKIKPARPVRIRARLDPTLYTLFRGYTDEYDVLPNPDDRSVSITALDGLAKLKDVRLSTRVYESISTGAAIETVLNEVGWPSGLRDIDRGATDIRLWWEEGTDAFEAIEKLVHSEGPAAIVYIGESGEFVFRDRHHRFTRAASITSQSTWSDTGSEPLFSAPLVYDAGWRDIVNSVTLSVEERVEAPMRELVWESDAVISIASGEVREVFVETQDPFNNARTPVEGIDFEKLFGTVSVALTRNSGQSTTIQVKASGGAAQIRNLKLFANPITQARTLQVRAEDTTSIANYGVKAYPDDLPWAGKNDAEAIAALIISQRSERLPIASVRFTPGEDERYTQMMGRKLSDRITLVDSTTGIDRDFYIEQIQHTISEAGLYHETTFGCEALPIAPTDVFILDEGELDVNKLGLSGVDEADRVFIFGDSTQGQFGGGLLAH